MLLYRTLGTRIERLLHLRSVRGTGLLRCEYESGVASPFAGMPACPASSCASSYSSPQCRCQPLTPLFRPGRWHDLARPARLGETGTGEPWFASPSPRTARASFPVAPTTDSPSSGI